MQEITAVLVAAILLGLALPHLVKNRGFLYPALAVVLLIILLDTLAGTSWHGFAEFLRVIAGLLEIVAIVLVVMSVAGQSLGEMTGEIGKTIDAGRHAAAGTGSPAPVQPNSPASPATAPAQARAVATPRKPPENTSIPLE